MSSAGCLQHMQLTGQISLRHTLYIARIGSSLETNVSCVALFVIGLCGRFAPIIIIVLSVCIRVSSQHHELMITLKYHAFQS